MQVSSINLIVASWLLSCLTYQIDAQRSYYVYEAGSRYHPSSPVIQPSQEYILSSISKPPPYVVQRSYYPSSYQTPRAPIRFPEETFDSQSGPRYYDYRVTSPDDRERGAVKDDKGKYQHLEEHEDENDYTDAEIVEKMQILDRILSEDEGQKDVDTNTIEGQIIAEANIPEETKRVVRQVRKQRPGFFWTLAKVTFQSINDTTSAIRQISQIISNSILPDSATSRSSLKASTVSTASPPTMADSGNGTISSNATMAPPTTTEAPFVLTRGAVQNLIRRNILGLVKLFNIEWRDAIDQSEQNTREFQKELGNQIGTYLQDNPNAY